MRLKNSSQNELEGSSIALQFMAFLASDEERLERFSALSGMGLNDLKAGAQNPVFLGFMLDYALQDESLILAFSESKQISPQSLATARRQLPGANDDF